jgi:hypothetical protein
MQRVQAFLRRFVTAFDDQRQALSKTAGPR